MTASAADPAWQRLDKWLWCARFLRQRGDCARLIETGLLRINRQPTDKPHARLRVGDVLTVPLNGVVRVVRVLDLAPRRGAAAAARALYVELDPVGQPRAAAPPPGGVPCAAAQTPPYRVA